MRRIVDLYLDRPRIFLLFMLFIIAGGLLSYDSLPRQENPQLAERWGDITAVLPGATPERIETQIADVIEAQLREIDEIKIIPVEYADEVLKIALTKPLKKIEWTEVDHISKKEKSKKEELSTH